METTERKSGNDFQVKVINLLRKLGWEVLVSPFYNDFVTDKPREIDIIAEYPFELRSMGGTLLGTINVMLFIECKYITDDHNFWFDNPDRDKIINRIIADTSLSRPEKNGAINSHHYLYDVYKVAKLFSQKTQNSENDVMYKALNQCLHAYVKKRYSTISLFNSKSSFSRNIVTSLKYPVIICSDFDNFIKIDFDEGKPEKISKNFQL